ncbi:phosphotransferase family protein, partial [Thermodesulfobacteriota bacterium]
HVQQAIAFFAELNRKRGALDSARLLPVASEACFSVRDHVNCVAGRVGALLCMGAKDEVSRRALHFVREMLHPAWEKVKETVSQRLGTARDEWNRVIGEEERCISPSDFGFHNAIRGRDGRLRFIDFEYAGWDDPAKTVCDFFCQQEVPVPHSYMPKFVEAVGQIVSPEHLVRERVRALLPLYRIKWCCIILNDFLSVGRCRREFAVGMPDDRDRRGLQLDKARAYLADFITASALSGELNAVH